MSWGDGVTGFGEFNYIQHFTGFIALWAEAGTMQPSKLTSEMPHDSLALFSFFAPSLMPVLGKQVILDIFL